MVRELADVDRDDELRGGPRTNVRRQRYVSSPASSAEISPSSRPASAIASDMRLASILTWGFSAASMSSGGLVHDFAAESAASSERLPIPRAAADTDARPASSIAQGC